MSKVTISYELNVYEDECRLHDLINASSYSQCLYDIHTALRNAYKHNEKLNDEAMNLIEELEEMILESGALRNL